jgi:septin 7
MGVFDAWSSPHISSFHSFPLSLPPSLPYSFINNMFASYKQGKDVKTPPLPHDGSGTKTSDFRSNPSSLCTYFQVTNGLERVNFTIQDTPGFGDDTDISRSIELILDHIDECNKVGLAGFFPSLPLSLECMQISFFFYLSSLPPSLPPSFQAHVEADENISREQPLGQTQDTRVDVCLYFLAAHRLKWIDIKFMQVGRE